jgi:hypothetical protein
MQLSPSLLPLAGAGVGVTAVRGLGSGGHYPRKGAELGGVWIPVLPYLVASLYEIVHVLVVFRIDHTSQMYPDIFWKKRTA